jgi:XTP/dITP diphosphohydrolase
MPISLLAATQNKGKLREFSRILAGLDIDVVPAPPEILCKIEETGESFEQNALIKAQAVFDATGCAALADDSGLCIDALGGRPGVHSARYMGEDTPYPEKMRGILRELDGVTQSHRTASFVCALALVTRLGPHVFAGRCTGRIADAPRGENGFGYDPLFEVGGLSFAEMSDAQKDKLSHRSKALSQLRQFFERLPACGMTGHF